MSKLDKVKVIRDPVHGDMEFGQRELDIVNTPQFQRMRGIRQLGLGHLVYPGAHHTRFEHSLGVAHMAGRIVKMLRKNCGEDAITDAEYHFVRALALIHDIGHVPFGHTIEDERPIYDIECQHDKVERLTIFLRNSQLGEKLLALGGDIGYKDLPGDLLKVMEYTHERDCSVSLTPREELLANIVGNTICSDLLDYLKRDPYFTGIHHSYDEKFLSAFEVEDSKIFLNLQNGNRLRRGVASEILHLLRLRYTLGERVYYHQTKAAASAMISKAVELSELPHSTLAKLRDEELLYLLENASTGRKVFGSPIKNAKQAAYLVKSIRRRRLYIPVYMMSRASAESEHCLDDLVKFCHSADNRHLRSELEGRIAKRAGIEPHQVVVYCPDKEMSTKAAMVNVLWPKEDSPIPLQTLCGEKHGIDDENVSMEIQQLQRKHELLWQLSVFVDAECPRQKLEDVSAYCQTMPEFHSIGNQNSDYAASAEMIAFRHTLQRAIEECPEGYEIDSEALKHVAESVYKDGNMNLAVDDLQKQIIRKSVSGRHGQMEFGHLDVNGNDSE